VVDTLSLPAGVQASVKNLPVGTASEPIPAEGGIIFLMVCKRTGTSAMDILRPRIKRNLLNERLDISAKGYLRDLRHAAFLDIRI
jgi:peptidyl-prolyl cis-trans isomerase SurA